MNRHFRPVLVHALRILKLVNPEPVIKKSDYPTKIFVATSFESATIVVILDRMRRLVLKPGARRDINRQHYHPVDSFLYFCHLGVYAKN